MTARAQEPRCAEPSDCVFESLGDNAACIFCGRRIGTDFKPAPEPSGRKDIPTKACAACGCQFPIGTGSVHNEIEDCLEALRAEVEPLKAVVLQQAVALTKHAEAARLAGNTFATALAAKTEECERLTASAMVKELKRAYAEIDREKARADAAIAERDALLEAIRVGSARVEAEPTLALPLFRMLVTASKR